MSVGGDSVISDCENLSSGETFRGKKRKKQIATSL